MEIIDFIWHTYIKIKEADIDLARQYLAAALDYYYTSSWEHTEGIVEALMILTKENIDFSKKIWYNNSTK
jgi:hypothetical protein